MDVFIKKRHKFDSFVFQVLFIVDVCNSYYKVTSPIRRIAV